MDFEVFENGVWNQWGGLRPYEPSPYASLVEVPTRVRMRFMFTDPDGVDREPEAVRYLLKKYRPAGESCLLQHEYESGAFPISAEDPEWSEWIRYDADLDSGKVVRFPPRPASGRY